MLMISYQRRQIYIRVGILILILLTTRSSNTYAQQIKTNFFMHMETLPVAQEEELRDFSRNLKDYVEGWDWGDHDLPEPANLHMEAFLAYRGSVVKTQYAAKLTASNGLDIKYLDRWWFFEFERDDQLQHDEVRFHPLTWLIDFYTHIMFGHELDKFDEFGGDKHFARAKRIAVDGRVSREYQRGWDERLELIENLIADSYKPYRRIRFLFYGGMARKNETNKAEAQGLFRQAIGIIVEQHGENARDENIKNFLNAHYLELADAFSTTSSSDVYETLIMVDPNHKSTYQEYLNKLGQ